MSLNEVHEIMMLLRGDNATTDGDYRNTHLGTVLEYLKNQQTESKATTLQKLSLMLGMAQRQIRENYIDGLIAFGIISLDANCKCWNWVGLKAIKGINGKLKTNSPENNEYVIGEFTKYANEQNKIREEKGEKELK